MPQIGPFPHLFALLVALYLLTLNMCSLISSYQPLNLTIEWEPYASMPW